MNTDFPEELTWANEPVLRKEDGNAYINEIKAGPHAGYDLYNLRLIEAVANEEGIQFDPQEYSNTNNEVLSMFLARHAIQQVNRRIQGGFGSLSPLLKNYLFRTLLEMHNSKYTRPITMNGLTFFKSAVGSRDLIKNFTVGKEVFWNFFTTINFNDQDGSVHFVIRCKSSTPSTKFCYSPGVFMSGFQGINMILPGTKMVVNSVNPEQGVVELAVVSSESDFIFGSAFSGIVKNFYTAFLTPEKSIIKWDWDEEFGRERIFSLHKGCYDPQLVMRSFDLIYSGEQKFFEYPLNPADMQFFVFFFCSTCIGQYEVFSTNMVNYAAQVETNALRLEVRCDFMLGLNRMPRLSWKLVQDRPIVELDNVVYTLIPFYNGAYYQPLYSGKDTHFTMPNPEVAVPGTNMCVSAQLMGGSVPLNIAQGNILFNVQTPMERTMPVLGNIALVPNGVTLSVENHTDDFSYVYFFWKDGAYVDVFRGDSTNQSILIRGLEPATKYYVTAMTINKSSGACSDIPQAEEIITPGLDPLPQNQQPRNFRIRRESYSSIEVEWDRGEGCTDNDSIYYEVLYRVKNDELNYWYKSVYVEGQELSAVISGLRMEQEYEIVLTATSYTEKHFRYENPLYARTRTLECVQHARCAEPTPSEAKLQWDHVAPLKDSMFYVIQVRGVNGNQSTRENEYTLSGLVPGTRYVVDVLVYENGVGYVSKPAVIDFVTQQLKQLLKPENVRAEEVGETSVTLIWDNNAIESLGDSTEGRNAFYTVLFRPSNGSGEFQQWCQVRETRCVVDRLFANVEYQFQVVPMYDPTHGGVPSDPLSVKTRGFEFENSNLECVSKTRDTIELKWNPFPGQGVRYRIYDVTAQEHQDRAIVDTSKTTYTVIQLESDKEYKLCVSARVEGRGESMLSSPPLVVRTNIAYDPPKVPGVKVTKRLHDKVMIAWDPIPDPPVPITYVVATKRSSIPMDGNVVFEGTSNEFVCENLASNTEYTIDVFARSETRGEPTQLIVKTKELPRIAPPGDLRVTQRTHSTVDIAWNEDKAADPEYGPITYKVTLDGTLLAEGIEACEYKIADLEPKSRHKVEVIAFARDIDTASPPAAIMCETQPHFVDAPSNFRQKEVTPHEVVVAWDSAESQLSPGEILVYKIEYRKDYESSYSSKTERIYDKRCEFKASKLDPDTTYDFMLYVSCDDGVTYNKDYSKLTVRTEKMPVPTLTGFTVSGRGPTYATVMWNRPNYPEELKVVVEIREKSTNAHVTTQETTREMLDIDNLTENTSYVAEGYFLRDDGAKGERAEKEFMTLKDIMNEPSALLTNCDTFDKVTVMWKSPAVDSKVFKKEDVHYEIELLCDNGSGGVDKRDIKVDDYDKTRVVLDALRPSTKYKVTLRAVRSRPKVVESNRLEKEFVTPGVPIPDPSPSDFEVIPSPESVTFRLVTTNPLFDDSNPLLRVSVNGNEPADRKNSSPITVGGLAANTVHTFEIQYTDPSNGAQKTYKIEMKTPSFKSDLFKSRDKGTIRYASKTKAVKVASPEMRYKDKPTIVRILKDGPLSLALGRERVVDNMSYILVGFCEKSKLMTAGVFGDGFFLDVGLGTTYAGHPLNYFARKVPEFKTLDMADGRKMVNINTFSENNDGRITTGVEMNGTLVFRGLPENLIPVVSLFFDDDSVEILNP